ncbi:MAG: L,D-transpeptidase family protein [Clostridia bacterium]
MRFNKLGEQASQGCVRLAVSDAKWVYDNCPQARCKHI